MDTLRGNFDSSAYGSDDRDDDYADDDVSREPPPTAIGTDERRMQVRAYNHWASLLDERNFPSIEDLDPSALPDFGPYSVLLDFTSGIENPAVPFLGAELAVECGADAEIESLADVPARSLLSRITDHYLQILANQAPIGFEAEFVNQRGTTILYRGILLPFSSDDDTIDFIYGVINWKQLADQHTTDELMLEIDQALDRDEAEDETVQEAARAPDPVTDWADGPTGDGGTVVPLPAAGEAADAPGYPAPSFGEAASDDDEEDDEPDAPRGGWGMAEMIARQSTPKKPYAIPLKPDAEYTAPLAPAVDDGAPLGLHDSLAAARECAHAARNCEDRSRTALYDAVGRAYDFSCAAQESPRAFAELVAESGLTVQDRAPMTPVVKLVFGADYDKTRLTEYAAVLGHAHRLGIQRGGLADFLLHAEGGLKGVVKAERQLRREDAGKAEAETPREVLARKLRAIAPLGFEDIEREGEEFGVVVIRRMESGEVVVLGEVSDDAALVERAARRLVA
ncbi:hypothetical protein [Pelagerythrobacter sp.]|uniref:PAS domain-containing protein n=1 Tax=Pelagerythrobacter sp. TaxID=2800702 RepID=UPI0035AF995A